MVLEPAGPSGPTVLKGQVLCASSKLCGGKVRPIYRVFPEEEQEVNLLPPSCGVESWQAKASEGFGGFYACILQIWCFYGYIAVRKD